MNQRVAELSEEVELGEDEELGSFDSSAEQDSAEVEQETQEQEEPRIPEKFQDKSVEEIVESYQNLEREFGRRNNEVGELRKLTDQLLNLQRQELPSNKEDTEKHSIDVDSLLENPSDAIDSALEHNPRLKALEDQFVQQQRDKERADFESKHPDWQNVVSSEHFAKWLQESPVRMKMFKEADQNYDYATGAELIGLYKQLTSTATAEAEEKQQKSRKEDLRKVSTEKSRGGASSKKVYRRTDLINLRLNDPQRYEAMEDEILLAYQEGRVR